MADLKLYIPKLWEFEGTVYENDPVDHGGATKFGVIVDDLKNLNIDENHDGIIDWKDIRDLTESDAQSIVKKEYWDVVKADQIINQSVAEMLADFGFNCGIKYAAKKIQKILGLTVDGNVGPKTIQAINSANQQDLFNKLVAIRKQHYKDIVSNNPTQNRFMKGWMNRVDYFKFKP